MKKKNYKAAQASLEKAKLWPENLGAGKPYDNMIDLRIETYLEAMIYERTGKREKAREKLDQIVSAETPRRRNQVTDLITALALKKSGRADEGEKLLKNWVEKQPDNETAKWAYAVYQGNTSNAVVEGNDASRIVSAVATL